MYLLCDYVFGRTDFVRHDSFTDQYGLDIG